jgi:hypothetical protein
MSEEPGFTDVRQLPGGPIAVKERSYHQSIVIPIFYGEKPTHIRDLCGSYIMVVDIKLGSLLARNLSSAHAVFP